MIITSKDNELIKHVKKLKEKKYRDEFGEYIIEGIKIIEEAIAEKAKIKKIIICKDREYKSLANSSYDFVYVDERVFSSISDVTNPQGVMAIVEKSDDKQIDFSEDTFLILDNIQDPGNMGTIIRTCDSLNMKQIIVSKGSADVYNPKVVRSTMGAIFRVRVIEQNDLVETIKEMKKHNIKVYATDLKTDKSIYNISYEKSAIVIGNEANGVSSEVLNECTEKIKIPMLGKTESLNAAIATSIILYEINRKLGKIK